MKQSPIRTSSADGSDRTTTPTWAFIFNKIRDFKVGEELGMGNPNVTPKVVNKSTTTERETLFLIKYEKNC